MVEEPPHARQQDGAERGQVAAGAAAIEQARVEPRLERVQRLREAGLRQIDFARRGADAVETRRRRECAQLPKGRNFPRNHEVIMPPPGAMATRLAGSV